MVFSSASEKDSNSNIVATDIALVAVVAIVVITTVKYLFKSTTPNDALVPLDYFHPVRSPLRHSPPESLKIGRGNKLWFSYFVRGCGEVEKKNRSAAAFKK